MTEMFVTYSFVERSVLLMCSSPVPFCATLPMPVCVGDTPGADLGSSTWVAAISPRTIGTTTRTTHQYFLGYVPVSTLVIARSLRPRRVPVLRDVRRPTL